MEATSASKPSISTLPMPGHLPSQGTVSLDVKPDPDGEASEMPETRLSQPEVLQNTTSSEEKPNMSNQPPVLSTPGRTTKTALLNGQAGYAKKVRRIKLAIKNTIFVNGAICDEVLRTEEKLAKAKEERRFLLRKLLQHQTVSDACLTAVKTEPQTSTKQGKGSHESAAPESSSKPARAVKRKAPASSSSAASSLPSSASQPSTSLAMMATDSSTSSLSPGLAGAGYSPLPGLGTVGPGESKKKVLKQTGKDMLGNTNVKSKKGKGVSKRVIPPLMLDSLGRPVFPMVLGDVTLHSIGEIVLDRPSFHSPESIFPAGYCITRVYGSLHKPDSSCLWTCKISENEDDNPLFEIAAEDSSDILFQASTPSDCHCLLLQAFTKMRGIPLTASDMSGLDFFGLSHPVIQNLVQSCPGARKCSRYKWVKFEINKAETNENVAVGTSDPTVSLEAYKSHLVASGVKPSGRSSQKEPSNSLRSLLTKGQTGSGL